MTDAQLLEELNGKAAELLERHLKASKEWFPHVYVPWERGAKLKVDEAWDPNEFPLPDAVRSSLFVNLLTEDNLPYYHAHISRVVGRDHESWLEWNHRWTAEEDRHSQVIRDYLIVSQAIDPFELERARMVQMSTAVVPEPPTVVETVAYVSLQELATRISHRNTGKLVEDKAGYDIMARVATDENHHFLFYRDLFSSMLEIAPSTAVIALYNQVRDFEMPGTGIPNFKHHAYEIARAGIYDLQSHHDQILQPVVMRHYKIEELTGLSPEAEEARDKLVKHIARVGKAAARFSARRDEELAKEAAQETVNTDSAAVNEALQSTPH